jgi:hypothetical protein
MNIRGSRSKQENIEDSLMIWTPRLVRKFENGNENIGHSTKYYLHYVDPKLCFSDSDPALALIYPACFKKT